MDVLIAVVASAVFFGLAGFYVGSIWLLSPVRFMLRQQKGYYDDPAKRSK